MSKRTKLAVQGFAGQQPLNQKPMQVGVAGFDASTLAGESVLNATIDFLNWKEGQEGIKSQKLRGIIKAISSLTKEGHLAYRLKLATVREVAKAGETTDERKANDSITEGLSAASFSVYMSNFKALSIAFEMGMAYDESFTWGKAVQLAVAYKKMHGAGNNAGRKIRVELSGVDKAVALVAQMTPEEYVEFCNKVAELPQ